MTIIMTYTLQGTTGGYTKRGEGVKGRPAHTKSTYLTILARTLPSTQHRCCTVIGILVLLLRLYIKCIQSIGGIVGEGVKSLHIYKVSLPDDMSTALVRFHQNSDMPHRQDHQLHSQPCACSTFSHLCAPFVRIVHFYYVMTTSGIPKRSLSKTKDSTYIPLCYGK